MEKEYPLVSAVINTFNRCKLVGRAIQSVTNQTYQNLEIIVIDANSSDDTEQVVRSFSDERVVYYRSSTSEISTCVNTGFRMAKGKYLALLDDDDEWLPQKIEKQVQLMETMDESYGWIGCGAIFWNDDKNKQIQTYMPHSRGDVFLKKLSQINPGTCGCSVSLVRKSAFERLGGFVETVRFSTDYLFLLKLSKYYKFDYVDEILYIYHNYHIYQNERGSVTKYTEKFICDKIEVQEYILKEYATDFNNYPQYRYNYYNTLARMHSILKNAKASFRYLFLTMQTNPASVFGNIRLFLSIVIHLYLKKLINVESKINST